MEFLRLLRSESAIDLRRLTGMAVIAGLSNAMVLAVINAAASPSSHGTKARLAVMVITVVIAWSISQRYMRYEASKDIERIIHRVRSRLTAAVSQMSPLVVLALLYLLVLSPVAFVIAMAFMSVAVSLYLGRLKAVNKAI